MIAILACALAGCWEEIHYTPPAKTDSASDATQKFADDVATQLADETAAAAEDSNPAPAPETTSTSPPAPANPPWPSSPSHADPARSPRRMAWLLGSNLSLAALGNDRGIAPAKVADWFDKAERLAKLLGTTIAPLPARPATDAAAPAGEPAFEYLFHQGQAIGQFLSTRFDDAHAALFELALKSNMLLVLYQPGATAVKSLSDTIEQAGERAQVPAELWRPLLEKISSGTPSKEVRDAVFQFHADVDHYLMTSGE